jgi:hypothetical protein
VIQQLEGVPGVFAGNSIDSFQSLESAQRDIPEIADWGSDHVELAHAVFSSNLKYIDCTFQIQEV